MAFRFERGRLRAAVAVALLLAVVGAAGGLVGAAGAQEPPVPPNSPPAAARSPFEVLQHQVDALQQQLDATTELPDETKSSIEKSLSQARSDLNVAQGSAARADQFGQQIKQVASEAKRLETALANEQDVLELHPAPDKPLAAQLATAKEDLKKLTEQDEPVSFDPETRTARRKTLSDKLQSLKQETDDVSTKLQSATPSDNAPLAAQAEQAQLQARKLKLERELAATEAENELYKAEDPLQIPRFRRELREFKINRQKRFVSELEKKISELQQKDAEERVKQVQEVLDGLDKLDPDVKSVLTPIVTDSLEYAQKIRDVAEEQTQVNSELARVQHQSDVVKQQFDQATKRLDEVGLTPALGLWLRLRRKDLPNIQKIRQDRDSRLKSLEDIQASAFDHAEDLEVLGEVDMQLTALLSPRENESTADAEGETRDPDLAARERKIQIKLFGDNATQVMETLHDHVLGTEAAEQIKRELRTRDTNLSDLRDLENSYTSALYQLCVKQETLIQQTRQFTDFIDERILWIRSNRPLNWTSVVNEITAGPKDDKLPVGWLLSGHLPIEVAQTMWRDIVTHPLWWVAVLSLWLTLVLRGTRLRRHLRELARAAENRVQTSFRPTLHAGWLTILVALPWPGLCLFIAWRLVSFESTPSEAEAFGPRLVILAIAFLCLEFFRQVCRSRGLAESHFGWNERMVIQLRQVMRLLILFGLPLALLSAVFNSREPTGGPSDTGAVEMLSFIASLCVLVFCAHRLLKPSTGVLREVTAYTPGGWLDRLRGLIWLAGVVLPVLLIVQTVMGYYDTARHLLLKVEVTVLLILGVLFVKSLLYRWLMLKHRRLRLDQLRQRRAAAEAASTGEAGVSEIPEVTVDPEADLHAISRQTERLVNSTLLIAAVVGIWFTWVDVLPALNYLDRWQLWGTDTVKITIVDLIWCLVLLSFTLTAVRNVPGLLEIVVLQYLPLDASVRYAISALTRYAIVLLGIVLCSESLGIGWSQVQWLAAALTFGLGFGLQEIFANFISGIIILFEQPVRVGDLVTIGDVSGRVSRIRIRATTITDWDRKDFIVPNKEFITGRLLNWTLTDTTNRVVINIGVAYGSDTNQVRAILSRVVQDHPVVLKDPAPLIFFEKFGDSSLDFLVMAYLPSFDNRVQTIHELNSAIHDELTKAGFEIPFPQRDLHVRSMPDGVRPSTENGANRRSEHRAEKSHNARREPTETRVDE